MFDHTEHVSFSSRLMYGSTIVIHDVMIADPLEYINTNINGVRLVAMYKLLISNADTIE